ncbi:MAG TPA: hypothetical protein VKY31_17550 [Terriglobia bacterium]|nr:hypothetical protein [Terriglobia bacterium]
MKTRPILCAFCALLCAFCVPSRSFAQWEGYPTPGIPRTADGHVNLTAPAPRTADGKPDLTGIWLASRGAFNFAVGLKRGETVPFNAEGKKFFDERQANNSKDEPSARCLPSHIALRNQLATPIKFVQFPGVTIQLYESRTTFRQIFTDGRPLPKVEWPTWGGYSVGRWEGDTFVVETVGFNGKTWLDQAGHPATDAMHLTERFTRKDFGHMELETIIDDPKVYSRPWSTFAQFTYKADTELLEYICEENERDSGFMVGK